MDTKEMFEKLSEGVSVEEVVPPKDELVTMTKEQLMELKSQIVAETTKRLMDSDDYKERLRLSLERDSAVRKVENRGQFSDPSVKVVRSRVSPPDHQAAVAAPHISDPSMHYRFINKTDDYLRNLRHHQGYVPIRDESGNEVRYMDSVLAKMPKAQYDATIGADIKARKLLRRQSAKRHSEEFKERARRVGIEPIGDGIRVDVTEGEHGKE